MCFHFIAAIVAARPNGSSRRIDLVEIPLEDAAFVQGVECCSDK
jgi:hypothetical protein